MSASVTHTAQRSGANPQALPSSSDSRASVSACSSVITLAIPFASGWERQINLQDARPTRLRNVIVRVPAGTKPAAIGLRGWNAAETRIALSPR